jgi:hypothetical protein
MRRRNALAVENQRAQDEALQAYLDQMSQMLTDKDRPSHRWQLGDSLSTVARARTLTVLTRLDGKRKGRVLRFLYESGLITKDRLILDLRGADLKGADLSYANLMGADLWQTNLIGAHLNSANVFTDDLEQQGAWLEAATMPNGQNYEDWLKSKGRGEDWENSGPS